MSAIHGIVCIAIIVGCFVSLIHSTAITPLNDIRSVQTNVMFHADNRFNDDSDAIKSSNSGTNPAVFNTDKSNSNSDNADQERSDSSGIDNDDGDFGDRISDSGNNENDDDDDDDDVFSIGVVNQLSQKDQIQWLIGQMHTLLQQRQHDDDRTNEENLKKTVEKTIKESIESDVQSEIDQLRHEVKKLQKGDKPTNTKGTSTIDRFSKALAEMREELTEVQKTSSNTSRQLQQHNQCIESINELREGFNHVKLEMDVIRLRQDAIEIAIKELQSETVQNDENQRQNEIQSTKLAGTIDYTDLEVDHRMRHQHFVHQKYHDLEITQKSLKHQLSELQRHHISDRLHKLEAEQKLLYNNYVNVTRKVASLDQLHGSMLELLEDVEGIQTKFDATIPDIRREIFKIEFSAAQLSSEQKWLREEAHNTAKSIQALAISVSTLQDGQNNDKQFEQSIDELRKNVTKLRIDLNSHRYINHKKIDKIEADSKLNYSPEANVSAEIQISSELVKQLESVELQYESIINKLPTDCSRIEQNTSGLFMIAPNGQQHPILVQCIGEWTTIQRRQDGSVDFNRSWDEYGHGFGTPSGEYWIGNTILNYLTSDHCTRLKVIMQDIYDNTWQAIYNNFQVASRKDGYRLSISGYSGNASDAFEYQNNMQFSAIDVDRDISNTHCAGNYEGGWWFSHCQHANLNGRYNLGLTWFDASRNEWIAVKSSHMMISKRNNCALPYTLAPIPLASDRSNSSNTEIDSIQPTTATSTMQHNKQQTTISVT